MLRGLSTQRRRIALAITILTALLGAAASGAGQAAAQGTIITRDTTINALAGGELCTPDGSCGWFDIHVSPDKEGTTLIVCVSVSGAITEEGCADIASTFAMDTDELSWATLAPTAVDLNTWVCNEAKECDIVYSRTITLSASWTATGELQPVKQTLGNPHGPCTVTDKIDGFVRDQAATITVDGASVETTGNLQVLDSKTARRTNCG